MPGDMETVVAVMSEALKNHVGADEKQNAAIDKSLTEIKSMVQDLARSLHSSTQRIHEQREATAAALRAEIKSVADATSEGLQEVADDINKAHARISGVKVWVLTGVIGGLVASGEFIFSLFHGKGGN